MNAPTMNSPGHCLFLFVAGAIAIGSLASVALLSGSPLVFPSLGPTALMLLQSPLQTPACPRNALCGHAIGILCGYGMLCATGLAEHPPTIIEGVHFERVICAALALALTGALMLLFDRWHPPAGATTLIIALGFITRPRQLLFIEAAVATLVVEVFFIHRIFGTPYPLWAPATDATEGS